jgi:hypothetical protein
VLSTRSSFLLPSPFFLPLFLCPFFILPSLLSTSLPSFLLSTPYNLSTLFSLLLPLFFTKPHAAVISTVSVPYVRTDPGPTFHTPSSTVLTSLKCQSSQTYIQQHTHTNTHSLKSSLAEKSSMNRIFNPPTTLCQHEVNFFLFLDPFHYQVLALLSLLKLSLLLLVFIIFIIRIIPFSLSLTTLPLLPAHSISPQPLGHFSPPPSSPHHLDLSLTQYTLS